MTIVDTIADEHYGDRAKLAQAFARIINAEARELVAEGLDVLQLDEPAFNVYLPEVGDWGMACLEEATAGLTCQTAVHICYGYGIPANLAWKRTLGDEWRQYERIFPLLASSSVDQVSVECAGSRVPLPLLSLLDGKDVLLGCIDVASERIETPEEVAELIQAAQQHVPLERIFPCTNCGMVPMPREVARRKLEALTAGAQLVRTA
jgi:5-methyltetrahydropteroyltriglutamate--homocysteine methyltransferase